MKTLPNGLTIFNATPHTIQFWREDWDEPIKVEPDEVISAEIGEYTVLPNLAEDKLDIHFVTTEFTGTIKDMLVVQAAYRVGADLVVGSIIAAQAYPGLVVGMTPAPGYERVPPAEKRMNPDKFTVF